MRIFEIDDEAEARVRRAPQYVGGLRHHILRFDGLALELGLGERLLEPRIGEIVVGLIAEAALRDDQGYRLVSRRGRRCGPKAQDEGRNHG